MPVSFGNKRASVTWENVYMCHLWRIVLISLENNRASHLRSMVLPLGIIFRSCFQNEKFPSEWKKANNNSVNKVQFQKHLGVYLDKRLDFREYFRNIFKMSNRTISLLRKLQNILPRAPLVTIYKSFIRPHLYYRDILYDQMFNNSFHEKLELIQYNAALATTGAIRGSYREKRYQVPGFESFQQRRWYRKLCLFFKMIKKAISQVPLWINTNF